MENSSIYVGIVIVSEDETGVKKVTYHGSGPDWHGLSYEAVVGMERALTPLAAELAAIGAKADQIMLGVGEVRAAAEAAPKGNSGK